MSEIRYCSCGAEADRVDSDNRYCCKNCEVIKNNIGFDSRASELVILRAENETLKAKNELQKAMLTVLKSQDESLPIHAGVLFVELQKEKRRSAALVEVLEYYSSANPTKYFIDGKVNEDKADAAIAAWKASGGGE